MGTHAHPPHGAPPPQGPQPLPGIQNIVAIGSGKGGVGKTTISVNLAVALSRMGFKVGLLDGDVYGPNVPLMLGTSAQPKVIGENRLEPLQRSEEHTSELQSHLNLVCRLLLEKKKKKNIKSNDKERKEIILNGNYNNK